MVTLSYLLISILAFQFLSSTSADQAFLQKWCDRTPVPAFCLDELLTDNRSLEASTPSSVTLIALDITRSAVSAANADITNNLLPKYRGKPEEKPISECSAIYSQMDQDIQDASKFVSDDSYPKATDTILTALARPDACESGFQSGSLQSPLADTDQDLKKKTALCMELANLSS